jgi:hypothetical protein
LDFFLVLFFGFVSSEVTFSDSALTLDMPMAMFETRLMQIFCTPSLFDEPPKDVNKGLKELSSSHVPLSVKCNKEKDIIDSMLFSTSRQRFVVNIGLSFFSAESADWTDDCMTSFSGWTASASLVLYSSERR